MPTPTEIITQQNKRISALTAENLTLEQKYLAVCRENDKLKESQGIDVEKINLELKLKRTEEKYQRELSISQGKDTQIRMLQALKEGLAKPTYIPEPPKSRIEPNI